MASIEEMLANVLASGKGEPTLGALKTASAGTPAAEELDVGAFVEDLGKTASALEKAAEALPTPPALVASQLKMLDNPLGFTKRNVHEGHRMFVGQVLPGAAGSNQIPGSLDEIQKSASLPTKKRLGSPLFGRLGR